LLIFEFPTADRHFFINVIQYNKQLYILRFIWCGWLFVIERLILYYSVTFSVVNGCMVPHTVAGDSRIS